jgi:hypothetical protein
MIRLKEFETQIKQIIQHASVHQNTRLGFDICVRLLAEYKVILGQSYLHEIEDLDRCINHFANYLNFRILDQDFNLSLLNKVELLRPWTDNLSRSEAIYVSNTVTAFSELLLYLCEEDSGHIINLSRLMTDCNEARVLDSDDQISNDEIFYDPILQDEFNRQLEIFNN